MPGINPAAMLHPRQAQYRRYFERYKARRSRLRPGLVSMTVRRSDQPGWTDYYPEFPGTRVEKVVFSLLVEMGVTFYFGAYWGDMPFTPDVKEHYRPDFILPEYRIIIEVFGAYWHSVEGAYERDARRAQLYTAAGYTLYIIWDYEIINNPFGCLSRIPELVNPMIKTGRVFVSERQLDPRASLASQRRAAPKVVRTGYRHSKPTQVSSRRFVPLAYPKAAKRTALFARFAGFPDEYLVELQTYSKQWRDYVAQLGDFYKNKPPSSSAYYSYWATWAGWWQRWQRGVDPQWIIHFNELSEYFAQHPAGKSTNLQQYYEWIQWRNTGARRVW